MPDPRNEVADEERPAAAPLKPRMHPCETLRRNVKKASVSNKDERVQEVAERIADRNAACAAEKGGAKSRKEQKRMPEDKVAAERQQPLIRHRKPDNSEYQQRENPQISVLRDPLKSNFPHSYERSKERYIPKSVQVDAGGGT